MTNKKEGYAITRKEMEIDDPFDRVAVAVTIEEEHSLEEMAKCFAAEFISMGWDEKEILRLFQQPFYRSAHVVYQKKGQEFIKNVIRQAGEVYKRQLADLVPSKSSGGK